MPSRRNLAACSLPLPHVASSSSLQVRLQEPLFKIFYLEANAILNRAVLDASPPDGGVGDRAGVEDSSPRGQSLVLQGPSVGLTVCFHIFVFQVKGFFKLKVNIKKPKGRRPSPLMPVNKAKKWHLHLQMRRLPV